MRDLSGRAAAYRVRPVLSFHVLRRLRGRGVRDGRALSDLQAGHPGPAACICIVAMEGGRGREHLLIWWQWAGWQRLMRWQGAGGGNMITVVLCWSSQC